MAGWVVVGGWRLEGLLSIQQLILIERGASRAGLIMLCDSRPLTPSTPFIIPSLSCPFNNSRLYFTPRDKCTGLVITALSGERVDIYMALRTRYRNNSGVKLISRLINRVLVPVRVTGV